MFKIAICDNDKIFCQDLKDILEDYAKKQTSDIEIDIFYSGRAFFEEVKENDCYNMVFLNVESDKMHGIEIGQAIREKLKNEFLKIVFISSKSERVMELFDIRPFNFLIKPLEASKVITIVSKAMDITNEYDELFEYKIRNVIYKIPHTKIVSLSSNVRKIQLKNCHGEIIEFYGKLSDVENSLGQSFVRVHKSHLLNKNFIEKLTCSSVQMINGDTFNVSRSYKDNLSSLLSSVLPRK